MTRDRLTRFAPIALTAAILLVFWDSPLVWPLKILVVLFHELSHAIVVLATGGVVDTIGLSPAEGGVTRSAGGWRFGILNAGYLGSLLFGIGLLAASRTPKTARRGVIALAAVLGIATLVWVRPLASFGFPFALAASAVVVWIARRGSDDLVQLVLRTLGVFSALYALWDIRADAFSGFPSDASALAELTWIPAPIWGLAWLAIGVGALWSTRRWWT